MILMCEGASKLGRLGVIMCLRSLSLQPDDGGEEEMRVSVHDPLFAHRWCVADGILSS